MGRALLLLAVVFLMGCKEAGSGANEGGVPIFLEHGELIGSTTPLPDGFSYIGDTGVGQEVYHAQLSRELDEGEGRDYLDVTVELTTDAPGAKIYFGGVLRTLRAQNGKTFVPIDGLGEDSAHSAYRQCLVLFLRNNAVVQVRSEMRHSSALELARAMDARFVELMDSEEVTPLDSPLP